MKTSLKDRFVSMTGSLSGFASILGSWQVCHNLCLLVIAALSVVGITLTGMPFLFLTEIVVPIWILAASLLAITAVLYFKKGCISKHLLLINTGLVIAGIPFYSQLSILYWSVGAVIVVAGIVLYIKDKQQRKKS